MKFILHVLWWFIAGIVSLQAQNVTRPNVIGPDGATVNSYTGNLYLQRNDLSIPAPGMGLHATFAYNSHSRHEDLGFGAGWTSSLSAHYALINKDGKGSDSLVFTFGDGRKEVFQTGSEIIIVNGKIFEFPSKGYRGKPGVFSTVDSLDNGGFTLRTKGGMVYSFSDTVHKQATSIVDRNQNQLTLAYDNGKLTTITHSSGQTLSLSWSGGHMTSLTDQNAEGSRVYKYGYKNGMLTAVTDPKGGKTEYRYNSRKLLNSIKDPRGNFIDISYNKTNGVSQLTSCLSVLQFIYSKESRTTHVLERGTSGDQHTRYKFDEKGNLVHKKGNCCGFETKYSYDANLNVTQRIDGNGNRWQYRYDNMGNVVIETTPEGNSTRFSYDSKFSLVTSITDKNGNTTSYRRDENGNVLEVNKPLSQTLGFTYNAKGQVTSEKDAKGNLTRYAYDDNGNLETITNALDKVTIFDYDGRGELQAVTNALNHVTQFEYDALGRRTQTEDALGNQVDYEYDEKGNITRVISELDYPTNYAYDALDRLEKITDALGHVTLMAYDNFGNLTKVTDPNGHVQSFTYDDVNRRITSTNGAGETTRYKYDGLNNLVEVTFPNGQTIHHKYDKEYRMISSRDNLGKLWDRKYDANGNLLEETDANNNTTRYLYDQLNRLKQATDPLGNSSFYEYDKNNNLEKLIDRKGLVTKYTYDKLDQQLTIIDALDQITRKTYDAIGNQVTLMDAKENLTRYDYDALGRVETEIFADNTTRKYDFDKVGNLIKRTDNAGQETIYEYDKRNQLISRSYPGGEQDVFSYDPGGRMDSAKNQHAAIQFKYDAADRLTEEILNGKTTGTQYDVAGRRKILTYPSGKQVIEEYDPRNRLANIRDNGALHAQLEYDAGNRLIIRIFPRNGTSTQYSYDANNQLAELIHQPGAFLHYTYQYDEVGNRLEANALHRQESNERFAYDELHRLTHFNKPDKAIELAYDALGKREEKKLNGVATAYAANNMNEYTSIGSITPTYDQNGNLTNNQNHQFQYDTENRLIGVNNGNTAIYQYCPLGRRISKTVNNQITHYYYDNDRVIEEQNQGVTTTYIYGTWIDDVISFEKSGAIYFYHANAIGSVA